MQKLKDKNEYVNLRGIQTGTDNDGESYYVDAFGFADSKNDVEKWLSLAGKYKFEGGLVSSSYNNFNFNTDKGIKMYIK